VEVLVPRHLLLIVLILTSLATRAGAQSDQQLIARYDRMYAAEKYEQARWAAEAIVERYPESAIWRFNAGAINSRLDRQDEAIAHLEICASLSFSGIRSFEQNADLDPLRERDDFKAIIALVRENARIRMGEFQREARAHSPKLYVPPDGSDQARPLVIALHGTGMDGESMYAALRASAEEKGLILVCPDALRPSGDGFSWTYRDEAEWFVDHLINRAVKAHNADPERVILIGFSQGANIALIMAQTEPERFLAVVPICGHYESQIAEARGVPAPTYLLTGARDPWRQTYTAARRDFVSAGAEVELRILSGYGHTLPSGRSGLLAFNRAIQWSLERSP
jgi:predicted esterase